MLCEHSAKHVCLLIACTYKRLPVEEIRPLHGYFPAVNRLPAYVELQHYGLCRGQPSI